MWPLNSEGCNTVLSLRTKFYPQLIWYFLPNSEDQAVPTLFVETSVTDQDIQQDYFLSINAHSFSEI